VEFQNKGSEAGPPKTRLHNAGAITGLRLQPCREKRYVTRIGNSSMKMGADASLLYSLLYPFLLHGLQEEGILRNNASLLT
jgi:hypothetical protein